MKKFAQVLAVLVALAALVVGVGVVLPETPVAGPAAEGAMTLGRALTGDQRSQENLVKMARNAIPTRTYYQYVDDNGRVQFAESLSDVPEKWRARVDGEITTWGICSRCLRQESARERAARREGRRRTAPSDPTPKHGRTTRSRAAFAPAASHPMPSPPCIPEVRYARPHFLVSILSLLNRPVQAARRPLPSFEHRPDDSPRSLAKSPRVRLHTRGRPSGDDLIWTVEDRRSTGTPRLRVWGSSIRPRRSKGLPGAQLSCRYPGGESASIALTDPSGNTLSRERTDRGVGGTRSRRPPHCSKHFGGELHIQPWARVAAQCGAGAETSFDTAREQRIPQSDRLPPRSENIPRIASSVDGHVRIGRVRLLSTGPSP